MSDRQRNPQQLFRSVFFRYCFFLVIRHPVRTYDSLPNSIGQLVPYVQTYISPHRCAPHGNIMQLKEISAVTGVNWAKKNRQNADSNEAEVEAQLTSFTQLSSIDFLYCCGRGMQTWRLCTGFHSKQQFQITHPFIRLVYQMYQSTNTSSQVPILHVTTLLTWETLVNNNIPAQEQ